MRNPQALGTEQRQLKLQSQEVCKLLPAFVLASLRVTFLLLYLLCSLLVPYICFVIKKTPPGPYIYYRNTISPYHT